jgi:hypothetical protein
MSKAFDCHQSNLNGRSSAVGCAFGALQPAASPHREHYSKGLPTAWQLWLRVRHSVKVHNERWIWLPVTRTRSCSDQRRVTGSYNCHALGTLALYEHCMHNPWIWTALCERGATIWG